jgi:hypothetical protein
VCPPVYCTSCSATARVITQFWRSFQFWRSSLNLSFALLLRMGAFRIISFEVGVFHRIVSSLTITFSITWKLTLLLLCLLSTTTPSTTTKKPYTIMVKTPCNQVMQHGSDLIGIQFFLMLHHDPDFIMFTRILKDKYDHSIDDQTEINALLFMMITETNLFQLHLRISSLHLLNQ